MWILKLFFWNDDGFDKLQYIEIHMKCYYATKFALINDVKGQLVVNKHIVFFICVGKTKY